jgi:predicted porin
MGADWVVLGKLETGFSPISGEIADACASLARMNGIITPLQITNGDSSRCGQAFNGPAYVGVSNPTYGTLTVGRQQSLQLDALSVYDPQLLAYAFSPLGYSGFACGAGNTEACRWDNAVKYIFQYGPFHAAGMYTNGGWDTAIFSGAYGGNAGFTWKGFSVDAVYMKENSVVQATPLGFGTTGAVGTCNPAVGGGGQPQFTLEPDPDHMGQQILVNHGNKCELDQLNGRISDNDMWSVMAKYTYEFTDCCAGSLKDGTPAPGPKLTIYAGYEHITQGNPEDTVLLGTSATTPVQAHATTIGGYILASVNNFFFSTDRVTGVWWGGARYELPSGLSFAGAYYRYDQNTFLTNHRDTATGVTDNTRISCFDQTATNATNKTKGTFFGNVTASNCGGTFDTASFVIDYQFNKHFDIYTGVAYSDVSGGLGSGFLNDNMLTAMSGMRLRF